MKVYKWIVTDTGYADCGVDIVGGLRTEDKALSIAALLNREFKAGRLDIHNIHDVGCDGDGQHLFSVFEVPEGEHLNPKYN